MITPKILLTLIAVLGAVFVLCLVGAIRSIANYRRLRRESRPSQSDDLPPEESPSDPDNHHGP